MNNVVYLMENGQIISGMKNAFTGEPIKRTKQSHPYSYEPFDVYNNGLSGDGSVWSDRLYQWDYKKFNKFCKEVWGNEGQVFDSRSRKDIERFLRLYLDKPNLTLNRIVEECNVSNGFPVWFFGYSSNE